MAKSAPKGKPCGRRVRLPEQHWEPQGPLRRFTGERSHSMRTSLITGAAASLALAAAGCTTTGIGTGQVVGTNVGATFTWTESGNGGPMTAQLSDGRVFQGRFFQITQESRVSDYGPLWAGWGPGWGWHRPWSRWGWGWDGWGPWGPYDETITHYTGQVLANLAGPGGYMRCHFTLARPYSGMAGGGVGQCQLPTGTIIQAQFPGG
jgi:hypothetical protein